ncbi:unnamed protein product, partial [Mesorhabditis belari]|uniref:J domain-containing protein n=1 Tax=Mesorhabditis belari TaxID=2138241 RepID=A0AAF3J3U5_9BILA
MNVDPVIEEKMDCVDLQTPMARKMSNEWSVKKSSTRSELVTEEMSTLWLKRFHRLKQHIMNMIHMQFLALMRLAEVKKKYRDLSKKHHPDRGGDPIEFDKIAKAYQALTDDEARENWEKYGNPDGPTAKTFGIALPKWLVSKEYGLWVLAFYGLIFMIVLPVGVGFWWYNLIKYNHDKVLLDTTQLFFYFLHKTPKMEINRMLMVLTGALEVWKEHNKEIVEGETDDFTLPKLMKHYPNLGENKKEKPLSFPYALKARILAYAYLGRHDLENDDLDVDQRYIIYRVLRLVEEMISCTQQLTFYSQAKVPFETMKNVFKLMPMFTQALWPKYSPLLQLPHIGEQNLGFIKRNKVHTCAQLARLDDVKRRQVLNSLSDYQYRDVLVVLSSMPQLQIETSFEVLGEEDKHEVTAKCLVTLKVKLTRRSLLDKDNIPDDNRKDFDDNSDIEKISGDENEGDDKKEQEDKKPKRKAWEKQPKKAKGKGGKKAPTKPKPKSKAAVVASTPNESPSGATQIVQSEASPNAEKGNDDEDDEESVSGASEAEDMNREDLEEDHEESDIEEDWSKPDKNLFETKTRETHTVHAPYYPSEKFEWWWLTLAFNDKKQRRLCAPVTPCKTLIDTQTFDLKFTAPEEKGVYSFTLGVHSDSYMDADYMMDIKLDVKEAKQAPPVKYEDTEEEEQIEASSDEEYTEDDDSE